jgi:hypothetical protein
MDVKWILIFFLNVREDYGFFIGFESRLDHPEGNSKNYARNPTGKFTFIQSETVQKITIHNLTILIFLKKLRFEVRDRDFWDIFRSNESKFWSEFLRFLLEYFYNFSAPTVIFQISHPSFEPNFFWIHHKSIQNGTF